MRDISFRIKLLVIFAFFSIVIMVVNTMMYRMMNHLTTQLEDVYESNMRLNELDNTLSILQINIDEYMSTKSSDAMENYYKYDQQLRDQIDNLSVEITDSETLLAEKNIHSLCESYLDIAAETIQAKRGRNVSEYGELSEQMQLTGEQIHGYIYSLNNELFKNNSKTYIALNDSMRNSETISVLMLLAVIVVCAALIMISTAAIIRPMHRLKEAADQVSEGNYNLPEIPIESNDEVGIVTGAFNQMISSIEENIEELKDTLARENELKERELMMQSHLKDAQLKYLQAQINPHFLFNTLNAGAQLAMMEDATKTGELLNNTAAFFRYNVRNNEDATIAEEVQMVDNYIYICNVRFPNEILFEKEFDPTLEDIHMPSMIIQPLVENAFNYGIRNIEREGRIELAIFEKNGRINISVWDNGRGMTQERIDEVLHSEHPAPDPRSTSSNGVGIRNLVERLRLYFGNEAKLTINSEGEEMGTEILISFPDPREE